MKVGGQAKQILNCSYPPLLYQRCDEDEEDAEDEDDDDEEEGAFDDLRDGLPDFRDELDEDEDQDIQELIRGSQQDDMAEKFGRMF